MTTPPDAAPLDVPDDGYDRLRALETQTNRLGVRLLTKEDWAALDRLLREHAADKALLDLWNTYAAHSAACAACGGAGWENCFEGEGLLASAAQRSASATSKS